MYQWLFQVISFATLNEMNQDLTSVINKLVASTKGILAADESTKTITKRMAALGLTSTPELNRQYRQMLLTTPGIEEYLGGVILYDETARQKVDSGELFPDYLKKKGILPGIKVDGGREEFKEKEIVTLCPGGGLSLAAVDIMREAGFNGCQLNDLGPVGTPLIGISSASGKSATTFIKVPFLSHISIV